jgi:hypothetical protein
MCQWQNGAGAAGSRIVLCVELGSAGSGIDDSLRLTRYALIVKSPGSACLDGLVFVDWDGRRGWLRVCFLRRSHAGTKINNKAAFERTPQYIVEGAAPQAFRRQLALVLPCDIGLDELERRCWCGPLPPALPCESLVFCRRIRPRRLRQRRSPPGLPGCPTGSFLGSLRANEAQRDRSGRHLSNRVKARVTQPDLPNHRRAGRCAAMYRPGDSPTSPRNADGP